MNSNRRNHRLPLTAKRASVLALAAGVIATALTPLSAPAAESTAQPVSSLSQIAGHWTISGKAKELEYVSEMVQSTLGLPSSQRLGTIGNGRPGSYDFGMRQVYKPFDVERRGELALDAGGKFSWRARTESQRSADCVRVIEFRMAGTASMQGERLAVAIADGEQTVTHQGKCSSNTPAKKESLAGQRRVMEVKVDQGKLMIRQMEPMNPVSTLAGYTRG